MAHMSGNDECPGGNFGDSSQFTNWISDSVATCHMTPEVSDFITGSLEDTDKYMEFVDGHHVTAKQKCEVQIKMCGDNSLDACTQFTSTEFKKECQTCGVCLTLAAPEHQEMNGQVEATWRTLRTACTIRNCAAVRNRGIGYK